MNNENNQLKYHWFLCAYKCSTKNNKEVYGTISIYQKNKNITQSKLTSMKNAIEGYDNSLVNVIVTTVSYLGFMTDEEFNDEPTN